MQHITCEICESEQVCEHLSDGESTLHLCALCLKRLKNGKTLTDVYGFRWKLENGSLVCEEWART